MVTLSVEEQNAFTAHSNRASGFTLHNSLLVQRFNIRVYSDI
ncbi:Uncharacterised protein [Vibrio cholerae]|nr:Uncharacterised protein [Vibrio cholerae]